MKKSGFPRKHPGRSINHYYFRNAKIIILLIMDHRKEKLFKSLNFYSRPKQCNLRAQ